MPLAAGCHCRLLLLLLQCHTAWRTCPALATHLFCTLLPPTLTTGNFGGSFKSGGNWGNNGGAWPQTRISETNVQPGQLPIIIEVRLLCSGMDCVESQQPVLCVSCSAARALASCKAARALRDRLVRLPVVHVYVLQPQCRAPRSCRPICPHRPRLKACSPSRPTLFLACAVAAGQGQQHTPPAVARPRQPRLGGAACERAPRCIWHNPRPLDASELSS